MWFKSRLSTLAIAAIGFCFICGTVPVAADIINVPGDHATIQGAIEAASNGDEVVVAPGVYSDGLVDFLGKAITLRSTVPTDQAVVEATILDGEGKGLVVVCRTGEGLDTVLDGFLIRNGKQGGDHGGGMGIYGTSPTVRNCIFVNNQSTGGGGGIGIIFGNPSISDCTFFNNTSPYLPGFLSGEGGGMLIVGNASVSNCVFVGNLAGTEGGGITVGKGNPTITNCMFNNNISPEGGGVYAFKGHVPTISESSFCDNLSDAISGVYNDGGGNEFLDKCDTTAPYCPWDLDNSGSIGTNDLLSLFASWGLCKGCSADFDFNGIVGVSDLLILFANWGPCFVIPELCGSAYSGSCFSSNGVPGCSTEVCCNAVCEVDPQCCEVAWDVSCVETAIKICSGCGNPNAGSCFEAHSIPSCDIAKCCELICLDDPYCCEFEWDFFCAAFAEFECEP